MSPEGFYSALQRVKKASSSLNQDQTRNPESFIRVEPGHLVCPLPLARLSPTPHLLTGSAERDFTSQIFFFFYRPVISLGLGYKKHPHLFLAQMNGLNMQMLTSGCLETSFFSAKKGGNELLMAGSDKASVKI